MTHLPPFDPTRVAWFDTKPVRRNGDGCTSADPDVRTVQAETPTTERDEMTTIATPIQVPEPAPNHHVRSQLLVGFLAVIFVVGLILVAAGTAHAADPTPAPTPTSSTAQTYTADQLSQMTVDQLVALTPDQLTNIPPEKLAQLTMEQQVIIRQHMTKQQAAPLDHVRLNPSGGVTTDPPAPDPNAPPPDVTANLGDLAGGAYWYVCWFGVAGILLCAGGMALAFHRGQAAQAAKGIGIVMVACVVASSAPSWLPQLLS